MSPVAEQDAPEIAVSKPVKERTYVSRRSDLILVLERDRRRVSAETGETVETVQGKRLRFNEGTIVVAEKGVVRGARGEQLASQYVIDRLEGRGAPGDEDFIQPHPLLGDREEGFWVLPKVAPPMSEEEAQGIVALAISGEVEKLEDLLAAEQDGWERADMLDLLSGTIDKVRAARETAPA